MSDGLEPQPAPGDPSWRSDFSLGQVFTLRSAHPANEPAPQVLRLDQGTWDIRAALLTDANEIAAAPGTKDPTFPINLRTRCGAGVAMWVDTRRITARGSHHCLTADTLQISVVPSAALAAGVAVRILVVARRVVVPVAQPLTVTEDRDTVGADLVIGPFLVPPGARFVTFYGPNTNALCIWRDANGNGMAGTNGPNIITANAPPIRLLVPPGAASITSGAGVLGNMYVALWECEP